MIPECNSFSLVAYISGVQVWPPIAQSQVRAACCIKHTNVSIAANMCHLYWFLFIPKHIHIMEH